MAKKARVTNFKQSTEEGGVGKDMEKEIPAKFETF